MKGKVVCISWGQSGCNPDCPHGALHEPHVVHRLDAGDIVCSETFVYCEGVEDYTFCDVGEGEE